MLRVLTIQGQTIGGLAPAMTRAHFDTPLMNEASQLNQSAEPAGSAVEADWGVKSSGRESTDT